MAVQNRGARKEIVPAAGARQSAGSAARSRRRLTLTLALHIGSTLAATGCKQPAPPVPTAPPAVNVSLPVEREVTDYAEFTARVAAVESTDVRARVSGQIVAVPFQSGTLVRQGDVLVEIDVRPFQADLETRIAEEARAAANLSLAQIEFDRIEDIPPDSRTVFEYDTASARLQEARAAKAAATAAVELAGLNVEWCRVVAPISGRISYKYVTTGNVVTGGIGSGTLLTTIVSVDPMYANFDVDERTVQRMQQLIREGKLESNEKADIPVWLGLTAEDGLPHHGTVNFVDNQVNPKTGTLRVRGVFPNADGALVPGYFARVRVPVSAPHQAVLVSDRVLDTDQGQKIVYVVGGDNKVTVRPVRVGALHDGLREIADGLKPGERVVVSGLQQVRPGVTVEPTLMDMPGSVAWKANAMTPESMSASSP
ncbi:MAG: efflux RND transporter periplasmic adaptor subunit [Phycisphaerae bacterium]|nr:efflux RND transporter periplasmic adaptor subunit [Phycisphaerae bacterium]